MVPLRIAVETSARQSFAGDALSVRASVRNRGAGRSLRGVLRVTFTPPSGAPAIVRSTPIPPLVQGESVLRRLTARSGEPGVWSLLVVVQSGLDRPQRQMAVLVESERSDARVIAFAASGLAAFLGLAAFVLVRHRRVTQ